MKKILFLLLINITIVLASDKCLELGKFFESKMDRPSRAIDEYLKGVQTNNADCMIEAARLYSDEQNKSFYNTKKSYSLLSKVLEIEPFNALVHYNLGTYYFNFNTKEQDINARYHFVLALFLGDKDAQSYVNQLHKSNSSKKHLNLVIKEKVFNKNIIAKRLEIFFKNRISLKSKSKEKIVLESKEGFKYTISNNELIVSGSLNKDNAYVFGNRIKLLQYSLYVDLPIEIENNVVKAIDTLLLETKNNKKLSLNKSFTDNIFKYYLELSNYSTPFFNYNIKFKENGDDE